MSVPEINDEKKEILELTVRTGSILRSLRDSLQQLGLDKTIADVAGSIPDARERLGYVVTLTREAADGVINSVEMAQPLQTLLSEQASQLMLRWDATSGNTVSDTPTLELAADTLAWLDRVPLSTALTNQQLHAIMMTQGFQDLTGQIVQRMMGVLNQVEQQLIQVLCDRSAGTGINERNAPSHSPSSPEKPANQDDVDDLLASLGI
ncbi:protein phosphatase CheZ [Pantoea piersonii]|uniref:protein phosphatase CheZ n=1 Tax=Pantoea piersonii TaxID=2364647 RepID=UPI0028990F9D|nr:protein phosphatase CheZ [Pantoea piersonii]